ncbi:MAG: hypothetical protein HOV81_05920 [Kofleriaceae bacterium]|nr:hypothetical protein [Kofleriaceae bacterium]
MRPSSWVMGNAFQAWLTDCGVDVSRFRHWWVEFQLEAEAGTRLSVRVDAHRWGLSFTHSEKHSTISFAGDDVELRRDDHELVHEATDPSEIGRLLGALERRYAIQFQRSVPEVRSNVPAAIPRVRQWLSIV